MMVAVTSDNPAWELYDLLRSWQITPAGETVLGHRSPGGDAARWWPEHQRALQLLVGIDQHLDFLRRKNPGREPGLAPALDRLRRGVFASDVAMEEAHPSPRRHFADADLQTLAATADGWQRLDAPVESLREMSTVAHIARDLVKNVEGLDEGVRNYLDDLIGALEEAAQEASISGGAAVARLALELSAALEVYLPEVEAGSESTRSVAARLRRGAKSFVVYFGLPYASQLAASATLLAIPAGPTG